MTQQTRSENMEILTIKINDKIPFDSLEYKSLRDENKHGILHAAYYGANTTNEDRSQELQILENEIRDKKARIFHIPIPRYTICHDESATINYIGFVYKDNGLPCEASLPCVTQADKENALRWFDEVENISFWRMRSKKQVKEFLKFMYFKYFSKKAKYNAKILQDPTKIKYLLPHPYFSNMCHFTTEDYAGLLIWIDYAKAHNLDYYIITPPQYRGYQKYYDWYIQEILDIESIPKDRIITLNHQNHKVKNLYHTSSIRFSTYQYQAIRKLQHTLYDPNFKSLGDRIYISRKKSYRRFLINDDEIAEILECEYGFRRIYMEDYDLKTKINIMLRTKVLMSVEGTSFMNGLFTEPINALGGGQAKLIGIRSHEMTNDTLAYLGILKNVEYLPIICDIKEQIGEGKSVWACSNLYLNPDYLRQKLSLYEIQKI